MTSIQQNKAIVRRYIDEVQNEHRIDALGDIFAAGFIDHSNTFDGVFQGIDGLVRGYRDIFGAFPDFGATLLDQIGEGDRVVTYKIVSATHEAEFRGFAATGNRIEFQVIDIFRIEDGLIAECWLLFEELKFLRQLGATIDREQDTFTA